MKQQILFNHYSSKKNTRASNQKVKDASLGGVHEMVNEINVVESNQFKRATRQSSALKKKSPDYQVNENEKPTKKQKININPNSSKSKASPSIQQIALQTQVTQNFESPIKSKQKKELSISPKKNLYNKEQQYEIQPEIKGEISSNKQLQQQQQQLDKSTPRQTRYQEFLQKSTATNIQAENNQLDSKDQLVFQNNKKSKLPSPFQKGLTTNTLEILQKVLSSTNNTPNQQINSSSTPSPNIQQREGTSTPITKQRTAANLKALADAKMKSLTLREKYEDLVEPQQEYIMPAKYKNLLNQFSNLDSTVYFNQQRNKLSYFDDLVETLSQVMRTRLRISDLQKILTVYPEAYTIEWHKKNFNNKYSLLITLPAGKIVLEDRKQYMKNNLIQLTYQHHIQFLKNIGNEDFIKQIGNQKIWHNKFDVHNVPDIEEAPLPIKPDQLPIFTIKEVLKENNVKNEILKDIMTNVVIKEQKKEIEKKELLKQAESLINSNDNKTGLSDRLYKIVKMKELKLLEEKQGYKKLTNQEVKTKNRLEKVQDLIKIAEIIKMYYATREVSNMFLVNVIEYIEQTNKTLIASKLEIEQIIQILADTCPYWIQILNNKEGQILRIDKKIQFNRICEDLRREDI